MSITPPVLPSSPIFTWRAVLRDDSEIIEYAKDGQQHLFKEVDDAGDDVKEFWITNGIKSYGVSMEDGAFNIDGNWLGRGNITWARHPEEQFHVAGEKLRLIYFQRTTQKIFTADDGTRTALPTIRIPCIGWQTTIFTSEPDPEKGRYVGKYMNIKKLMFVHPNGEVVIT